MIHRQYTVLSAIAFVMVLAACSKLEDRPLERITEEYLWDSKDSMGTHAGLFVNSTYAMLPSGFNRIGGHFLDAATDDAVPSEDGTTLGLFTSGGYSALSNGDNAWGKNYEGIRRVNLFLSNIHKVNLRSDLRIQKQYWSAEMRFLRAMFYYELIKRYGGVPLIGDRVLTLQDDLTLPRAGFDECVEYIVNECDVIQDSLLADPVPNTEYGRISKGVAMTLKAKALLLAASPLNNPNNDAARWVGARNAFADVIRLAVFTLEPSFANVFTVRRNSEVILAYQRNLTFDVETNNAPIGYISGSTASRGRTSPTQELVDAFGTIKGLPITEDIRTPVNLTGYDASRPYLNRDPRLALTVFFNGADWLGRVVETFDGGRDRPGGAVVQTKTGYYMRKFMGDFSTGSAYSNLDHNHVIFRYADVLLSFAEAKNEMDGPSAVTDSIYTALIDIRRRAGILPGDNELYGLPETVPSKETMRTLIQNERRVEMAFEEQRFWDLRRWRIAEYVYNQPLHGIRITNRGGILTYSKEQLNIPFNFYAPRMYRYAIPQSEIVKNSNLQQNEGYE